MIIIYLLVFFSLVGIFYAYFGYPVLLTVLSSLMPAKAKQQQNENPIACLTIVIAAKNEARVIETKLENTLHAVDKLQATSDIEVQIIVASDGSTDATHEIVTAYRNLGVELSALPQSMGKEHSQKAAIELARGDVIFFTDSKIKLEEDGLINLLKYFSDPTVGAVSSVDIVEGDMTTGSGEGMYVRYEMWLREMESRLGSLVGLSGSGFATRKAVAEKLDTRIPSDFSLLLAAKSLGLRGVHAPDVICRYKAVQKEEDEFSRKVRTVLRGITAFFTRKDVLNPLKFGVFSFQMLSHKLMRWLVPIFFVIAFLGSVIGAGDDGLGAIMCSFLAIAFVMFLSVAFLAYAIPSLRNLIVFKAPLFFVISNCAIFIAWIKYLSGQRTVSWTPSAKG